MNSADTSVATDPLVPLRPAQPPRARSVGLGVGVALLLLAGAAIRELIFCYAAPTGWDSWTLQLLAQARALPDSGWFWGGLGVFLLGLWLIVAAFRPRLKLYTPLAADAAVWVRRVDLARYATATATTLPGVLAASTLVTRRRIVVTATVAAPDEPTRERLHHELAQSLAPLLPTPLELRVMLRHDEELSGPLPDPTDVEGRRP